MPDDREKYRPDPLMPERTMSQDKVDLPEKGLGGADAVPDTNYVPRTETGSERPKGKGPVVAAVSSGNGTVWAILAFLFMGAVLVYLLGYGR